jgi:hypothetical protein
MVTLSCQCTIQEQKKTTYKKKVATVQMVHPYTKLNPNHLKITKIKTNTHMNNKSRNLESGGFTYLTKTKFFSMCQRQAQLNLLILK